MTTNETGFEARYNEWCDVTLPATVAPTANASEAVVNTTPNETTPSNTTSPVSVGFDRMKSVVKDMIDDLMKTIVQGCGQAISGIFDRWSADAN